ncbi:snoRNA-binding protein [Gurleya vavrai]
MLVFAEPFASKKLTKKIQKCFDSKDIKVIRGIRAAQKAILKGEKGFLVIANDISPPDLVSHFPAMAEEFGIRVVFVENSEVMKKSNEFEKPTGVCFFVGNVDELVERLDKDKLK